MSKELHGGLETGIRLDPLEALLNCANVRSRQPNRCGPNNTTTGGVPLLPEARERARLRKSVCEKCNYEFDPEVIAQTTLAVETAQKMFPDEDTMKEALTSYLLGLQSVHDKFLDEYTEDIEDQAAAIEALEGRDYNSWFKLFAQRMSLVGGLRGGKRGGKKKKRLNRKY